MWIRPSMPSRSTKAPKSTMFEIWPDDVAGLEAVEDLLALLLALVLEDGAPRQHDVVPRAVELDHLLHEAPDRGTRPGPAPGGCRRCRQESATPRSRIRPPFFTTSITRPRMASPDSAFCSIVFQASSNRARFLERISSALSILLGRNERVDLLAELDLVLPG